MPSRFDDFNEIYRFTNPRDITGAFVNDAAQKSNPELKKRTLLDMLTQMLVDPSGGFTPFEEIRGKVKDFLSERDKSGASKDELNAAKFAIHAIGNDGIIDFGDENYYAYYNSETKVRTPGSGVKLTGIIEPSVTDRACSAIAVRSPHLTPAKRGTEAVEFFLNYTPSIMASRLQPFLSVEMELETVEDAMQYITTPNVLRFLVGSGDISQLGLTEADKALIQATPGADAEKKPLVQKAFTGMEMFLLPQGLTNMDALEPSVKRLVRAKPFVPFASIESFTVNLVNAGSGAMVHKKGNLKIKVHDKARLAEISEFIRGPVGYKQATIWTTYGHLCPRTNDDFDFYAKFVNENMHTVDCWMVANSQYSFDLNGQVTVTLELVSKGIVSLQNSKIVLGDADGRLENLQSNLQDAMAVITDAKLKLQGTNPQGEEIRATQILNQASMGIWPDQDVPGNALASLIKSLRRGTKILSPDDITELQKALKTVKDYKSTANAAAGTSVVDKIDRICRMGDDKDRDVFKRWPADETISTYDSSEKTEYAPPAIWQIIDSHENKAYSAVQAQIEATKKEMAGKKENTFDAGSILSVNFNEKLAVLSFGHLFMQMVAPSILADGTCNELQVVFYGLNDSCGPVSGLSIAEFPIDMISFSYALRDALKTGTDGASLTVPRFLQILIESQFNDNRALGYGMSKAYKAYNPFKPEAEKVDEKIYESVMTQWFADYGSLQRPVIEMYMETGRGDMRKIDIHEKLQKSRATMEAEVRTGTTARTSDDKKNWIIKRIHIYDKTNTPYKLTSRVFSTKDGYIFGHVDSKKTKEAATAAVKASGQRYLENLEAASKANDIQKIVSYTALQGASAAAQENLAKRMGEDGKGFIENDFGDFKVTKDPHSVSSAVTVREVVKRMAPNINLGTNGSLVKAAALSSKTDGLMGSINIINANKTPPNGTGGEAPRTGLENPNGLPLRVTPAQLQMTSIGCAIAQLYQQYFIDFGTGTTIDNLYNCTQIAHTMGPGKFETSWTFVYTDGYGKFTGAPDINTLAGQAINEKLAELRAEAERAEERQNSKKRTGGGGGAATTASEQEDEFSNEALLGEFANDDNPDKP